jgi:hypothetical protein
MVNRSSLDQFTIASLNQKASKGVLAAMEALSGKYA